MIYESDAKSAAAGNVTADLSDCFAVIIVTRSQDTNEAVNSKFVPMSDSCAIWNTDNYKVGDAYRWFTVTKTGVAWTASSQSSYPNAFVIPDKIYALPNKLLDVS